MPVFKGWVPTVSGCLSFSIFGENDYPRKVTTSNVADSDLRYIVSWQKRLLTDTVLPLKEKSSRVFFGQEGAFWCVCIASCSNNPTVSDDQLTGNLYLFHGEAMWNIVKNEIVEYQEALSSLSDPQRFNEFKTNLIGNSSYYVEFNLSRNGVAELTSPKDISVLSKNAPKFPQDGKKNSVLTHRVSSQLFFFLKDIAHRHQHHDPSTDTMVDIYEADDDYRWRCNTLRILLRKILEFKRSTSFDFLSSSLGLLAYTNSFRDISNKVLEDKKIVPDYNQQALEQSIRAAQEVKSLTLQSKIRTQELFKSLFFSIIGIMFAVVGLGLGFYDGPKLAPKPYIIDIASFIVEQIALSIFFVAIVIFIGMILLGAIEFTKWKLVRNLYRIIQALNLKAAVVLLSAIAIASMYGAFRLGLWLVANI